MEKKISVEDLLRKLNEPGVTMQDLSPYFHIEPDAAGPFGMSVVYDAAKVELDKLNDLGQRAALALPGFNTIVRMLRRAQFEMKLASGYSGPVIVAEGDSWFTYPWLDVVGALNDLFAISHLAAAGDTLAQMLDQNEYIAELHRVKADILLFSGGGNDALGGGDLKAHLLPFDKALTPAQHLRSSFSGLVDGAVGKFDQIYRRVAREAPGVAVICHGYDYAIPDKGKWLGTPMKQLGITDPAYQRGIVHEMMDRFALAMSRLAARYPHVTFLDNRGTVKDADWADELHPSPPGFAAVARKFAMAIRAHSSRDLPDGGAKKPGPRGEAAVIQAPQPRRGLKQPTGLNHGISLHIGLNILDKQHYGAAPELFGCHYDAHAMERIAKQCGYGESAVLLDGKATVTAVQAGIRAAAKALGDGDIFLLTYAGHGSSVPDFSGDELDDGKDETWCLYDREMLDDELYDGWRNFKRGVRVLVISDSCHSGSVLRATLDGTVRVDLSNPDLRPRPRTLPEAVRRDVNERNEGLYRDLARKLGADAGKGGGLVQGRSPRAVSQPLNATVRLLSGCQDNQTSGDGDLNGLFTSRLLQVLEGGFKGNYAGFHRAIKKLMPENQTPNHWAVGRKDPAFDAQHPFEI